MRIAFVLGLLAGVGVALLVHELGHVLVARMLRVPVHRFTFGFGPVLWTRWTRNRTQLLLRALPFWASSELEAPGPGDPPRGWRRAAILLGGPLAGALFAFGLLVLLYATGTHVPVALTVGSVAPGSQAARAQVRPGDEVVAVEGQRLASWGELVDRVDQGVGRELAVELRREGQPLTVRVRPAADEAGIGRIGVAQQYVYRRLPLAQAPAAALVHLVRIAGEAAEVLVRAGRALPEVQGRFGVVRPVAIQHGAEASDVALRALAALSALLALFHLAPIPPLDGGALLLLWIERLRGARFPPAVRLAIQLVGFALLAGVGLVLVARLGA